MLAILLIFALSCNAQVFPIFENSSWVAIENSTSSDAPVFIIVQDISGCPTSKAALYFNTNDNTFYDATCTATADTLDSTFPAGANVIQLTNLTEYMNDTTSCRYFFTGSCGTGESSVGIQCSYGCSAEHSSCSNNVNTYDIANCCSCPALAISSSACGLPSSDTFLPLGSTSFIDVCGSVVMAWFSGCGNGISDGSEECDGTSRCEMDCTCGTGSTANTISKLCEYCGDNVVQPYLGEHCEASTDSVNCNPATCLCNVGVGNNNTGICEFCGDSIHQGYLGEDCDGVLNCVACSCIVGFSPDGSGNCVATCGNGILNPGEECDTALSANCLANCMCPAGSNPNGVGGCDVCGDGIVSGVEYCDDRHCDANCTACAGTAIKDTETNKCILCGNNVVDPGEACDTARDAHCDADCLSCLNNRVSNAAGSCVLCGNKVVDSGETCDGPACKADCSGCIDGFVVSNGLCTTCGNGKIDNGEACDTALSPAGGSSNCKADCTGCEDNYVRGLNNFCTLCGNGVVDTGESCDGKGCKADCSGCYSSFTLEGTTCVAKQDDAADPNDNSRPSAIVSSASVLSFVPFSLLGLYYFSRI